MLFVISFFGTPVAVSNFDTGNVLEIQILSMGWRHRTKFPKSTGSERKRLRREKPGIRSDPGGQQVRQETAGILRFSASTTPPENVIKRLSGGGKATGIQHSLNVDHFIIDNKSKKTRVESTTRPIPPSDNQNGHASTFIVQHAR